MSISSISPRSDAKPAAQPGRRVRSISDDALTVRIPQMCAMLNIGPTKAAELVRTGAVESILLGKTRLVKVSSILALMRQSTQRILKQAEDLDGAIQKALDFEGVFTRLKEYQDPLGAALDALDKEFGRLIRLFTDAGASAEEFARLEELYGLERAEAFKDAQERLTGTLRDFIKGLEIGDSGLSIRARLANAQAEYNPLADAVRSGGQVDYGAFTEAAQDYLNTARELYGSQAEYFAIFNDILGLSKQALADQENVVSIGSARPSPFDTPSIDTVPVVAAVDAQSQMLLTQLVAVNGRLDQLIDVTAANGTTPAAAAANYF